MGNTNIQIREHLTFIKQAYKTCVGCNEYKEFVNLADLTNLGYQGKVFESPT